MTPFSTLSFVPSPVDPAWRDDARAVAWARELARATLAGDGARYRRAAEELRALGGRRRGRSFTYPWRDAWRCLPLEPVSTVCAFCGTDADGRPRWVWPACPGCVGRQALCRDAACARARRLEWAGRVEGATAAAETARYCEACARVEGLGCAPTDEEAGDDGRCLGDLGGPVCDPCLVETLASGSREAFFEALGLRW